MNEQSKQMLEFGPYRIHPGKRLLLREEVVVQLPSKVFDTLLALIQHRGEVISKDDLMKIIWPDSFVEESNLSQSIFLLRKALGETAQDHRYIVTIPGRGYRFVERVVEVPESGDLVVETHSIQRVTIEQSEKLGTDISLPAKTRRKPGTWIASLTAVIFLAIAGVVMWRLPKRAGMTEADLVLVSDFVNTTGEPVFDGALKQALTVKLAESPYFNIVPDSRTRQILGLMGHSSDEKIVPSIARDVCQREGAKIVVGGSILSLGNKYVLDLDATDCLKGSKLAHEEIEASNKDEVLNKLGQLISPLRRKLGESLNSIEKFDTPIEQATTKSLAALKAYTSGDQQRAQGHEAESIPFYKMAIELDPDFAIAYARLGTVYGNLHELDLSNDYLQKAFERRQRVSEMEKFYIQAHYYDDVLNDQDQANQTFELWSEAYPHAFLPLDGLSSGYITVGQLGQAIEAGQRALKVNPNHALGYASLSRAYERSSRFAEAKVICERAVTEKVDSAWTHLVLYRIAFVEGDELAMQHEADWFKGKPQEGESVYYQAKVALSQGKLHRARELFAQARGLALKRGRKETAVAIDNGEAQFEADLEELGKVPGLTNEVLRFSPDSEQHKAFAALALARAGKTQRAQALVTELSKRHSLGTHLDKVVLPSIRAALDLDRRKPHNAIEELKVAVPYDLGTASDCVTIYYRGLAFLQLKSGPQAAAQFQRILANRGVVAIDVYWPLAHLGLARAYAMTKENDKSGVEYREVLAFWQHADPNLRLLKEAKAEYSRISAER